MSIRYDGVTTGVVAERDGKYWGVQWADGQCTCYDFGPIDNATVVNADYCHHPTTMVHTGSRDTERLRTATLRRVKVTTIYEVD
jgi:hypothetical protein